MGWSYLLIAGIFEVAWAIGMKYTDSFSRFWPSVLVILAMLVSVYFLTLAIKTIPVGTAYAVWTGIGIAGTTILGALLFQEPMDFLRLLFIFLILVSVVGLKVIAK
jgi:quaternary ammonium compound-resistance protein SugE